MRSPQGPGPFGMSPESRPAARPAPADTAKSGPGQVAQLAQKFGGQSASSEKEEKPKANEAHEAHEAHEAKGAGPVGPGLPHGPVNGASGASATSGATSAAGGQAATSTSAAGTRLPQPMAPGQLAGRLPTLPLQRAGADRVDRVEAEASRDPVQRRRQQVQAAIAAYDQADALAEIWVDYAET
ncbi:unnamed protein product [Effrenium voratum]|nr:unnamed protein product [Effrenium voratum]